MAYKNSAGEPTKGGEGFIEGQPPQRERPCKYVISKTWDNPESIKNRQKNVPFLNLPGYITHERNVRV